MDRLGVDVEASLPLLGQLPDHRRRHGRLHYYDEFKIGWRSPKDGGWYYDMLNHPLAGEITEGDIDRFPLPDPLDPARFTGLREMAIRVRDENKRAVVMGNISAGIFEPAHLAPRVRRCLRRLGYRLARCPPAG